MHLTIRLRCLSGAAISMALLPLAADAQHVTEQVVVTATPGHTPTNELAQSVTVVSGLELDRVRGVNLGETLAGQLGVSASSFGAGASRPIIRGLAGARVRTMEDGIEAMDASTVSGDHAVGIDPLVARQIEIFRGPTTLLYGSGAVGGVINSVTNRIPEEPPGDGFDAVVELRGDTVADERTIAAVLDGGNDAFAWHFDLADRQTDDFGIPGPAEVVPDEPATGVLANSSLDLSSAALGASWHGDNSFFGVSVSGYEMNYGIPGHAHAEEEEDEDEEGPVRIDLAQTRINLKGGWENLTGLVESINLRLGVNDYEHVELEGGAAGTRFGNDAYEGRFEVLHRAFGRWRGAVGLQLTDRDFSAIGDEAFVPPVETAGLGAFVLERFEAESWQLSLGARIDRLEHKPSLGSTVSRSAVSLSVAGIRELGNDYSLAINVASAERIPVAEELYSDGPHLATSTIEIGDTGLGNETARHLDLGIRKTAGERTWSVTMFATDYADFIYLSDSGLIDVDEELPVFFYAQQDADFFGVEAEIFTPLATIGGGELDLRLFGDIVRAELASGEKVPRIPPMRLGARLAFHAAAFSTGIEIVRHDGQDDLAPFETPTPGFTLVSADFERTLATSASRELNLFLRASNLLDEEARRHSSLVKDIAPLPGRNYSVGLRVLL